MKKIGVQYYRPPFPDKKYWKDDIKAIADSGLNTIQLWVIWAWVEPSPGKFEYEDYDELISIAQENNLKIVLSTIAEIHPYWIHRHVPGSEMIDNMGNRVISSNRGECHFGLTPGGCFDHPQVWELMKRFLEETVKRYKSIQNLAGWDAWNELRWNVNADGLVCYCQNTIRKFREFLDRTYGGLDGLNKAWRRRYRSWEDVMPGKSARSPYTEMMAFERFIMIRSVEHAWDRYTVIKNIDPVHDVTVHGAAPSVYHGDSYPTATALHRGNDWYFAEKLDGVGCSSFPTWGNMSYEAFAVRIDCIRSVSQYSGKKLWLSELQGGRSAHGFNTFNSVKASEQQKWLWTGISQGADTILFWCWRDEVFGCESSGFGITGNDGMKEERLTGIKGSMSIIKKYERVFDESKPVPPEAGVLFSPESYFLHWIEDKHGFRAVNSLLGYAEALLKNNISYTIVEESHLDILKELKILFMPRILVIDNESAQKIISFVKNGGTVVCESECGAFDSAGIYRYPEERPFAIVTGIEEIGRRKLRENILSITYLSKRFSIPAAQWITPLKSKKDIHSLGKHEDGLIGAVYQLEKGKFIFYGSYAGELYYEACNKKTDIIPKKSVKDFENFIRQLSIDAGCKPMGEIIKGKSSQGYIICKMCNLNNGKLMYIFGPSFENKNIKLKLPENTFSEPFEITLQKKVKINRKSSIISIKLNKYGFAIITDKKQ